MMLKRYAREVANLIPPIIEEPVQQLARLVIPIGFDQDAEVERQVLAAIVTLRTTNKYESRSGGRITGAPACLQG